MNIEKVCKNCELYTHCLHYGKEIKETDTCEDWEIAFSIYQCLPDEEARKYV